eukprot:SM000279S10399  [mRNA]  locus=s279:66256:67936:- [translate_table: standard]
MDGGWRSELKHDARERIVSRIMEVLQKAAPTNGQDGMSDLLKLACKFEQRTFSVATDQSDYLRKISVKMLSLENKVPPGPAQMQGGQGQVELGASAGGLPVQNVMQAGMSGGQMDPASAACPPAEAASMAVAHEGWPTLSVAAFYEDPLKAIDFLCSAFGFAKRIVVPNENGDGVRHSELTYGDAVVMVSGLEKHGGGGGSNYRRSPRSCDGSVTMGAMLYVADADAHCAAARAAGAAILQEPELHDYGPEHWADRSYEAADLEGHRWWFAQRVRNPPRAA